MLNSIVVVVLFPFPFFFTFSDFFFYLFGLWDFLNRYIITFRLKLPFYLVLCPVKSVCCLLHSLFGWLLFFLHPPPLPPF